VLRRLLVLVSAVVLVDVAFYSAITPLLPYYTDLLDLSKSQAGLLAGAYAAGTLLLSLPAGLLAARVGPRATLLGGLALLTLACVVFGFGERYELLVGARFAQGVAGAACWASGMAWLLAEAPADRRGELIGTALGVAIAGALGGPILGALADASSPSIVFSAVAAVTAGLAVAVVSTPRPPSAGASGGLRRALTTRRVLAGAWLTTLPALFFGATTVLASLRFDALEVGAAGVAAVFLVAAGLEAAVSPIVGRFSDRRGRRLPMTFGVTALLAACLLLPLAETDAWLLAVCVVAALALGGVMWAPAMSLISDGAARAGVPQGLAFGIVNLAWAGGQVAGSVGGSATAQATSDAAAYGLLAVLAAGSLLLLVRGRREDAQHDPAEDRRAAERLRGAERVVEDERSDQRADERLEVDERARELGGHARLADRVEREGEDRPRHHERRDRGDLRA
jgi:MFS family permease